MSIKKAKLDILIVLMQAGKQSLKYLKLKLQQNTELQQIVDFLKAQNKLPFRNCIFTTKPAEKGQFTMQKTIKEVSAQCKMKDGAAVLLCYESQVQNSGQESFMEGDGSIRGTQLSDKGSPSKQKQLDQKKQDHGCIVF